MDPRRARDPRLARHDPRIQQATSVPTPVPTPPPVLATAPVPGAMITATTPQNGDTGFAAPFAQQTLVVPKFKQRPLFCVVCASNQVGASCCDIAAWAHANLFPAQNRSMEGHHVLAYVLQHSLFYVLILTNSPERLGFASYLPELGPLCACRAHR